MSGRDQTLPIAVVGAGFSGTMAAIHLLRMTDRRPILLYDRSSSFAKGIAYSTTEPTHLLNVRSANMSAYPDDPEHFSRWIDANHGDDDEVARTPVGIFVSRKLYGRYLTQILHDVIKQKDGAVRLRLVPDEIVDLAPMQDGYRLKLAGGLTQEVAGIVLAVGNLLREASDDLVISNPWSSGFWNRLTSSSPVIVMGTGLTMVDVAMQLKANRFSGPIIAISRRGLLPQTHALTSPWPRPSLDEAGKTSSVVSLLHCLRQEERAAREKGLAWQSVVDSIRPVTTALWQSLSIVEQQRFLRHARPWWDVHRHRMAPPVAKAVHDMLAGGYLDVRPGRIVSLQPMNHHIAVEYRPRGKVQVERIIAQRVIDATGAIGASEAQDPLLKSLIDQGLARLDQHSMGLEVTENLETIDRQGQIAPGLWALGPIVRGVFWECTSVPDIRSQAVKVATRIAATMADAKVRASS